MYGKFLLGIFILIASAAHSTEQVGVVVIDVQKAFVSSAANKNMAAILDNIEEVFRLSNKNGIPFFITYEGARTGDHDIPAKLKRAFPADRQAFTKTTFNATGLPAFANAIRQSGLTRLIVLGSETDVCVMQTVHGLRNLGIQVMVQKDAVFSSESNPEPAFRRMMMSGASLVDLDEVRAMLNSQTPPPPGTRDGVDSVINPLAGDTSNVALILNIPDAAEAARTGDRYKKEKLERLRELLILSDWLQIPTYIAGSGSGDFPLSNLLAGITPLETQAILKKVQWLPFDRLPANKFKQVFVAGMDQKLAEVIAALGADRQVFLLEDALLSGAGRTNIGVDEKTLVPLTYKSLFYGMLKSISSDEWPSQIWVQRDGTFSRLMLAPEELAPIL